MHLATHLRADAAVAMTAVLIAAPLATSTPRAAPSIRTVAHDVTLTAAVPPGGLITSFLHNQTIYCSIICPLLAQTGVTAVRTSLQAPGAFLAALPTDGLFRAFGIAAAQVTGPTDAAMEKAIAADAAIPAKRALNAFEVAVVGLLNVVPAVTGGPSAVLSAVQRARQQTFDALNAPVVPNPAPTVMPRGVVEVAAISLINVVAAVIFPAFNDFLAGAFQIPDAMAQELAASGNPVRAFAAGLKTGVGVVTAAAKVIAQSIVSGVNSIRTAAAPTPVGAGAVNKAGALNKTTTVLKATAAVGTPAPLQSSKSRATTPKLVGAQSNDRGSQTGRPSRPAPRAKR